MKKILFLFVLPFLVSNTNVSAEGTQQFFASYTGAGVNRLFIKNCLHTIYSTGIAPYKVYAIVTSDFDISVQSNITFTAHTGYTITIDLPTDRSAALTSSGLALQTKKNDDNYLKDIVLYIRKINKATIPYSLNFGSSFPYNTDKPDFNGWGYRELNNSVVPQLTASTSRNCFFLAFNPSLPYDSLVCNFYASNNNSQSGLISTINASSDGKIWSVLKEFSNNIPVNSASKDEKRVTLALPAGTQYIKYLLVAKGQNDPNININTISIKRIKN